MEKKFDVEFLDEAVTFMDRLDRRTQEKIYYNIRKAQMINDPQLFKKLTPTIWEFRTLYDRTYIRIFAFWDRSQDKQTVVVATHGLIKKSGRTPSNDPERAERIRQLYFLDKS